MQPVPAPSGSSGAARPRWASSTALIFYALALGVVVGALLPADEHPAVYGTFHVLSKAFISLIKMLIVPLIFSTIVVGIGKTGDIKAVGRMGVKALVYFEVATTFALAIGLTIAHVVRPGAGMTLPPSGETLARPAGFVETLLHLFPSNVVEAMARQDILQVVVFATLLGVGAAHVRDKATPFLQMIESLVSVVFQVTDYVMALTPIGVFGAMGGAVSHHGLGVLASYAKLVGALYGALVVFVLLVLVPALLLVRADVRRFVALVREPLLLAFSTASSEAALPRALEAMVAFGVPPSVAGFVLPAGYSFNLDGSTLYLSLASLTIAQAAHVDMPLSLELLMMLTFLMTSKGVAGVPRASLVVIAAGCASFSLPGEAGVAMILAVDELMDMARTSVNVMGNCVASVVVARWEGVLGAPRAVVDVAAPAATLALSSELGPARRE